MGGKLSCQKRSARRPGRRERVHLKKNFRGQTWSYVAGEWYSSGKLGRKKSAIWYRKMQPLWDSRLVVKHSSEPAEGQQTTSL